MMALSRRALVMIRPTYFNYSHLNRIPYRYLQQRPSCILIPDLKSGLQSPLRQLSKNRQGSVISRRGYSSTQDTSHSETSDAEMSEDERRLFTKLSERFQGGQITVQDVSGGCGQFYAIQVCHSDFAGLSTLKQHRLVNQTLSDEIKGIHGLQIMTRDS